MPEHWLKVEVETPDKPEIDQIARELKISIGDALLACFRVWAWFDTYTLDGNARSVTSSLLERYSGVHGITQAMRNAGWLKFHNDHEIGITLPKFDKHNGVTAKKRAQTQKRVEKHRIRNAPSVTKALPEGERDIEREFNTPPTPQGGEVLQKTQQLKPDESLAIRDQLASELQEPFDRWVAYRKEIRKPLKSASLKTLAKRFREWGAARAIAAVDASIANGYQGLFEPTGGGGKPNLDISEGGRIREADWGDLEAEHERRNRNDLADWERTKAKRAAESAARAARDTSSGTAEVRHTGETAGP